AVQANVARCRELGYAVVDPVIGDLAAGEGVGAGRLPEPEALFAAIGRALEPSTWNGLRVLVTAGPTREAIDPVRYISNESSGRMGVAIAAAAWRRGAHVTLVHGPLAVETPAGIETVAVTSTDEMHRAVQQQIRSADVVVMAAAPADFAVADIAPQKLKKDTLPPALALTLTTDILADTASARKVGAT